MLAMFTTPLLVGCSAATRPDPAQAFDELTKRSLNDDAEYVRAHVAPGVLAAAKGHPGKADTTLSSLMNELQRCRSMGWRKTEDPNKVAVDAACAEAGMVQQATFDMTYDPKVGWILATPARDKRPLEKAEKKP
jgi:hypothetical protein